MKFGNSRTAVFLLAAVAIVPATSSFSADSSDKSGLTVVDANKKVVGFSQSAGFLRHHQLSTAGVARFQLNGEWIAVLVGPGGFAVTADAALTRFYTTSDCTGQEYLEAASLPVTGAVELPNGPAAAFSPTGTLFYPAAPQPLTIQSIKNSGKCSGVQPKTEWVGATTTAPVSFTAPFSLQ